MSAPAKNVYTKIMEIIQSDKGASIKKRLVEEAINVEGFDINAEFNENQNEPDTLQEPSFYRNRKFSTPLTYVIKHQQPEIVKLFLDKGARVNIPDSDGRLPLDVAIMYGSGSYGQSNPKGKQIVALIIERFDPKEINQLAREKYKTPLMTAIREGSIAAFNALLEKKADVNLETDDNPNSPLAAAILAENLEMVQKLVAKGADLSKLCRDRYGEEYENALEFVKNCKYISNKEIKDFIAKTFELKAKGISHDEKESKAERKSHAEGAGLPLSSGESEVISEMRRKIQALESENRTLREENKKLKEKLEEQQPGASASSPKRA